jgi:heme/copper-type cytochrome/quinol oxidase subunit 3
MSTTTHFADADVAETLELGNANYAVIGRLGAAAQAFFFVAFLFAFFYLRALNSHDAWKRGDVHVSTGYGVAVLVCVLVSVAATIFAAGALRTPNGGMWRLGLAVALVAALAAVAIQCANFATTGFGPGEGGFASVYFGWTGLYAVNVLVVAYWLTVSLTETLRPGGRALELIRGSADALALYWAVLGLIEIVAFILLYLVA